MIPGISFRHIQRREMQSRFAAVRPHDWLTESELRRCTELHDRDRQEQWLFGRLLAKELISDALDRQQIGMQPVRFNDIEIDSRDEGGQAVRPSILLGESRIDYSLSISHTDNMIAAALSHDQSVTVGVDLVSTSHTRAESLLLWMTPRERKWLTNSGNEREVLKAWGLKEAIYKATNRGEHFVPHRIEILPNGKSRYQCFVNNQLVQGLQLDIKERDSHLMIAAGVPCFMSRTA